MKDVQDIYTENYITLMREIKDDQNKWRYIQLLMDQNTQYS